MTTLPYNRETPIYEITCPSCRVRQTRAIPGNARIWRCDCCERYFSVIELRSMITNPMKATGVNLGQIADREKVLVDNRIKKLCRGVETHAQGESELPL